MPLISINHSTKRTEISAFEVENAIIFNFFNKLAVSERDDALLKALHIGVLALMEDRLSTFLAKTTNHLGTELESLKMIFDMKQELFFKSSAKGMLAEDDIASFLEAFFSDQKLTDELFLTGNTTGALPRNKTGDIVTHINGDEALKISIECKFDKSIRLGDISSKDIFTRRSDTAWSQLLEAQVNRNGVISIIVFDASSADGSILNAVQNIKFIPSVGFIVIVDSQKGNYSNLAISYMLARDIAINSHAVDFDKDTFNILILRLIKDIVDVLSIKSLVLSNIENNKKILYQLEKSMLSIEFSKKYFDKFMSDGTLSKKDLFDFYVAEDIRDKYRVLEKEIKKLTE